MRRRIITFLKNFFINQENRIIERQLRTDYSKKRENLTDSNILVIEDKLNIINKKFSDLRNRIKANGTGRFTVEQLFEFKIYKKEYNKLTRLKKWHEVRNR